MMSEQTARRLSWSITGISISVVMIGLMLSALAVIINGHHSTFSHQFFTPVLTITYCVVGALVASRHPQNLIGWMFCVTGLLTAVNMLSAGYSLYDQLVPVTGGLPGEPLAQWLDLWLWLPNTLLPFTFLLLLFPNGRLLSVRWRPVAWAAALGTAAIAFAVAFDPEPSQALGITGINPFAIPGAAEAMNTLLVVATPLILVGIFGSIASVVVRFRRAVGVERAQVKWLAYAAIFVIVGNLVGGIPWLISPGDSFALEFSIVMTFVTLVGIVAATGIAILRYRLWDIDIIINRTLVYGALTVLVVAIYVLLVGSLGNLLQSQGSLSISLFGTGIIAVSFQPLRNRLQRGVNRLMYGERDDPYAVLAHLSERLEVVIAPQSVLPTIVETVADAFKLPYAAIRLKEGKTFQTAAEFTRPSTHGWKNTDETQILPLVYQSETVGEMILAPRAPGEQFSETDRRLLETIARQAGVAAYNVRLTQDLQRSRERLVTTREEERRRLRRDLHDGLGPLLAAMSFKLDAVHNLAGRDPDSVKKMAAELKTQVQAVLGDIRRIAYGLRPPALDELGLVGALKAHIASYNQAQGLDVTLDAPEDPPSLPAAVEVATYRIALEAITNVSRHARAKHCCVRLSLLGDLCLEVTDDGRGLPNTARAGVGLTSMRERAEELGGTCRAFALPQGGTEVIAHLPLSSVYAAVAEET
ncbi:MAG TPA: GAF domain-containing sensor histidine kinase [Aggregatilineaceae bacterium]|nr:GAF domain-containing sensor histidine kinase [Aggregatilineaceae bacterium]